MQEYYNGFPLGSLGQLLKHGNLIVRRVAIWIVSELGSMPTKLAEHVIPLLKEEDRYLKYHALESIMVLSSAGSMDIFHHLISSLESEDDVIRKLGMYLISNASDAQLKEAIKYYSKVGSQDHIEGLTFLLNSEAAPENFIGEILISENDIFPRYGVIFLKRSVNNIDRLKISILNQSTDNSIKMFANEFLKV